jgi:Trk K+ transport system NAD-binding subunit
MLGANALARLIATELSKRGVPYLMVDTNSSLCEAARKAGLAAAEGSVFDEAFLARQDLAGMAGILALTSSASINVRACVLMSDSLRLNGRFALIPETATERDRELNLRYGVVPVIQANLDMNLVLSRLNDGLGEAVTLSAGPQGELPPDVMPLLVETGPKQVRPFEANELLAPGAKAVCLRFRQTPAVAS